MHSFCGLSFNNRGPPCNKCLCHLATHTQQYIICLLFWFCSTFTAIFHPFPLNFPCFFVLFPDIYSSFSTSFTFLCKKPSLLSSNFPSNCILIQSLNLFIICYFLHDSLVFIFKIWNYFWKKIAFNSTFLCCSQHQRCILRPMVTTTSNLKKCASGNDHNIYLMIALII